MELITDFFKFIYVYCTDFLINIANLLGLSYYEVNAVIFCFIYPLLTLLLPIIYLFLQFRCDKIFKKSK
jgi:hypothetical protein